MTAPDSRPELLYTFGNHMHWVDMEWLWGYDALPGSVDDMIRLARDAGVRGNVNFDGVGFHKLAAEAPATLAALRAAVADGTLEIVGGSWGQPYGLFHGGESNVRQFVFGVRAVRRLLDVRPRTFWEEEFWFFPQLPQLLAGAGYTGASLFFQWTWHTPAVPLETDPVILWEGIDGTRIPTAARTAFCLHQWPEDFDVLLESPEIREGKGAAVVQWLELMPSPDWMCRSELLLPRLRELLSDPRFRVRSVTLGGLLERFAGGSLAVRRLTMDDVFHGMSLGKNGDRKRRASANGERFILAAEALSAAAGLLGRPYASWDVYPAWEIDEAWRELLAAQHHDNDECEGLCGFVGDRAYEKAAKMAHEVTERTLRHLRRRSGAGGDHVLVFNPLGFPRDIDVAGGRAADVPGFGFRIFSRAALAAAEPPPVEVVEEGRQVTLTRGGVSVLVDGERGVITAIRSPAVRGTLFDAASPLGELRLTKDGAEAAAVLRDVRVLRGPEASIRIVKDLPSGGEIQMGVRLSPIRGAVEIFIGGARLGRPDGGMNAGLRMPVRPGRDFTLVHDTPFAVDGVTGVSRRVRKYPTGDWMTSPQVFENLENPLNALSLLDFDFGGEGLLLAHNGSQQFFRVPGGVEQLLTMYDPWDGDEFTDHFTARILLMPHGPLRHTERWRVAQEFHWEAMRPLEIAGVAPGALPDRFAPVTVESRSILATAFHREAEAVGRDFPSFAGRGLGHPFVLRLVEWDGAGDEAVVRVAGHVARAVKTNLLGETLDAVDVAVTAGATFPGATSVLRATLRPREVATFVLDIVEGRKEPRDLDARREVWARVHRREAP